MVSLLRPKWVWKWNLTKLYVNTVISYIILFSKEVQIWRVIKGDKFKQFITWEKALVVRQKGESQNGGGKKTKHSKFSEKRTFLSLWYAHRVRISR